MAEADVRNEQIVREMTDAIWGADGSPGAVERYFAPDLVDHEPGQTIEGRDAYVEFERSLREGMPDLAGEIDLLVSEGELVAVRYTATGTHTGSLWGIEPTDERVEATGQVVYRFEDGEVVEAWHEFDRLGMLQQLGVVPDEMAP